MTSAIQKFFKRFVRDTRGSIIIVAAFAATGLIAVGGSAYDFGMQQMAWKNGQFAGDVAATSAAGSRMSEYWGRGSDNPSVKADQLAHQKRLVEMYFRINSRGFDVDPSFQLTEIDVIDQGDIYKTIVRGNGTIPSNFVRMVGVDELPYTIETVTNLVNPGAQPTYDMALILDFTKSMSKPMAGCDGGGVACTRAGALQRASTFLNNVIMCGNESGQGCLGDEENENRLGTIPYGLTAVGLDPCDLSPGDPDRPDYCVCVMPRSSEYEGTMEDWTNHNEHGYGHDGDGGISGPGMYGMPDAQCRERCAWIDSQGRPASDPESDVFSCECFDVNNPDDEWEIPPDPDTPVTGGPCGANMKLGGDYPDALAQCSWLNFCTQGGCCPPKCIPGSGAPGTCDAAPGSRACAQCQMQGYPTACGCAQPIPGSISCSDDNDTPDDLNDDTGCGFEMGPTPPQTYACHHQSCTCSCSATGGPSSVPPCGSSGANPEQGCTPVVPPPPWPPGGRPTYGMNQPATPQAEFASAIGIDEATLFSAVYQPEANDAKVIMASSGTGVWEAYSIRDCADATSNSECQQGIQDVIDGTPSEGDTNSAAAFDAFERHDSYLNYMRPNAEEPEANAMSVIVWVSDGENNSFVFPGVGTTPPIVIPKEERVEGTASGCRPNIYEPAAPCNDHIQRAGTLENPGPDWDAVRDNCYDGSGGYVARPNGAISGDCPANTRTAQGWSDFYTMQQCNKFRTGSWVTAGAESRPITIYTVYVHDGSDPDALAHTRELMSTCSYGEPVGSSEDPPAGQQRLFFSVTTVEQLNRTFRTISNSLGRIRIVD